MIFTYLANFPGEQMSLLAMFLMAATVGPILAISYKAIGSSSEFD